MEALIQDVRYAARQLLRQRGTSIVQALTLALGIGASTAIFSVVDAAMLRPLAYPSPEQLVAVDVEITPPDGRPYPPTPSMADMRLWQQADAVFSAVAGLGQAFRGRIVDGPEPARIEVSQFTEAYLSMHGVTPLLGRDFTREDTEFDAPADEDGAGIGPRVVDAVGDGEALGLGAKVVVIDPFGAAVPLGAGIAERADEFLLLGIDADDRDVVGGATLAQVGDVPELVVAPRMRAPASFLWLTRNE